MNPAGRLLPLLTTAVLLALAAFLATGCGSSRPAPERARSAAMAKSPEPFQAMRVDLTQLRRLRDARDSAAARAYFGQVLADGKRLLTMPPPNDLDRQDVPRFLEGRATFTDELNAYGLATGSGDDGDLWRATAALESAFWGWYDAYRGRPSEGAV